MNHNNTNDSPPILLGRLEGKVDLILTSLENNHKRMDGHETRIRKLESSKSKLIGAGLLGGFLASIATHATWITTLFGGR